MTADIDLIGHKAAASVARVCRLLERPRSTYYARRSRKPTKRDVQRARLEMEIRATFKQHRGRYGSPRIREALARAGHSCSEGRVAREMQRIGLRARQRRRFRHTSASNPAHMPSENLLCRNFTAERPNQVWVGDVTQLETRSGIVYIALLEDRFCHTIVGWAVSTFCDEALTRRALERAVARRRPGPGLIHHTDRGATYTAGKYRARLRALGVRQSMSRKGDCWDNAPAESLNGTVKRECFDDHVPLDAAHVRSMLFEYIEAYYNITRFHSSNGYLSPREKMFTANPSRGIPT